MAFSEDAPVTQCTAYTLPMLCWKEQLGIVACM